MTSWEVAWLGKKPQLRKAVLVEGLPGMGNVGKVAVDFLIDNFHAKRVAEFRSQLMPHSVFVNEKGLVELPKIELYCVDRKNAPSLLLLAGDVQPVNEESCYDFCALVVGVAKEMGVVEIITTGGIGLRTVPKKPKIYVTGTSKAAVKPYAKLKVNMNTYGTVGPIVGVAGVLCGIAGREGLQSVALLAEVFGHPLYLGVRGAKEMLRVMNGRLNLKLDFNAIEREIQSLEKELTEKQQELTNQPFGRLRGKPPEEVNYIG